MLVMHEAFDALVDEIRISYHFLADLAGRLHDDIDPSGRAVLEHLTRHDAATVPQIARSRHVSRQHIQSIVNGLLARGLVKTTPNPAHRRSHLIALTDPGRELIHGVIDRERTVIEPLAGTVEVARIREATITLAALRAGIGDLQERP
jgi:DNA-binding MarR family transcriptional regulator